jgi:hypothetical protein
MIGVQAADEDHEFLARYAAQRDETVGRPCADSSAS